MIVLPPAADELIVLDGVAAYIWELLDEPTEQARLVRQLAELSGADVATVVADVEPFLGGLRERSVLERLPALSP